MGLKLAGGRIRQDVGGCWGGLDGLPGGGGATILTQSIRATPRGPFRLAPGLLRRQLGRLIAADLGRLKDLVEAEITHS